MSKNRPNFYQDFTCFDATFSSKMFYYSFMNSYPLSLLISATIIVSSCTSNDCSSVENELAQTRRELASRDSSLTAFGNAIQAIDSNVIRLSYLEQELSGALSSSISNKKEKIQGYVDELRSIMASNQNYIDQMQMTLENSKMISSGLMNMVKNMEEKVTVSNLRLARHNTELESLGSDFKNLFEEYIQTEYARMELESQLNNMEGNINKMEDQVRELKNYLNTAYFVIGSKKELIEKGVLEKGGLLNSKDINENVDKMAFQSIDTRKTNAIPLNSDKVKIVTEHPKNSYQLLQDASGKFNIEIKDAAQFWNLSKYLIVIEG